MISGHTGQATISGQSMLWTISGLDKYIGNQIAKYSLKIKCNSDVHNNQY